MSNFIRYLRFNDEHYARPEDVVGIKFWRVGEERMEAEIILRAKDQDGNVSWSFYGDDADRLYKWMKEHSITVKPTANHN